MVTSVIRAIDLLEAASRGKMGLVDLSRATGLSPSTTHRLLATLRERGLVDRDEEGRYALSANALPFPCAGSVREREFMSVVRPQMERVYRVTHLGVNLSALEGDDVVFAYRVESTRWLISLVHDDIRMPFHVSASGKSMMALRAQRISVRRLVTGAPESIFAPRELRNELALSRVKGFSVSRDEYQQGVTCVASPMVGRRGEPIAALSVSGESESLTPDVCADIGELLRSAAHEASDSLLELAQNDDRDASGE